MSTLYINSLELNVYLGWRTPERRKEQAVLLDMTIRFANKPEACATDHLDDTVCYDDLILKIRQYLADKHYHLIEHLAEDIYQVTKPLLPENAWLNLRVTKHPKIDKLIGGVSFEFGDA